jgi:cell division cycle 2-like protein
VLYNNQGILRICDFGMARQFGSPLAPYTEVVCTLWYRAPEMLLGTTLYGCEVDMWSVGCLMAEFLTKETLFPGQSEADQIDRIFQLCGTPNEERWPGIDQLRFWRQFRFKKYPNKLRVKFPRSSFGGGAYLSDQGFDLLSRLLEYDPKKRINVDDALNHPWFKELPLPRAIEQMPTFPSINKADRFVVLYCAAAG